MTYVPYAILLTIGFIFLTVLGELKKNLQKPLAIVNAILAAAGAVILAVVYFAADSSIGGSETELAEWAGNMLSVYYQITIPVFLVLLGVTLLSSSAAIPDRNQHVGFPPKIRVMASCASSVILLIIAPFYGFMTVNDSIPLHTFICWFGVGQALVMRLSFVPEYFGRIRSRVKKM